MPHNKTETEVAALGETQAKAEHDSALSSGFQNCLSGYGELVPDAIKKEIIQIATDATPWVDPEMEPNP